MIVPEMGLQPQVDLINALRPFLGEGRQQVVDRLIDLCQSCEQISNILGEAVQLGRSVKSRHAAWVMEATQAAGDEATQFPPQDDPAAYPADGSPPAVGEHRKEVAEMGAGLKGIGDDSSFIVFLILILLLLGLNNH